MDACKYCKDCHAPHTVCDGYIEWLKRDLLGDIDQQKKREAEAIKTKIEVAVRRTEKLMSSKF